MNPKEYLEFLYKLEGSYGPFKLSNGKLVYSDEDTIKADFAIAFTLFKHKAVFFLKSKGDFDVRTIARLFDGNGSKNAAEFNISASSDNFRKALEDALDSGKNIPLDKNL
jgi:hypothetical protein